ncbi:hypothetical protein [Streptomyces sp. NPDC029004]|uniref:hypothetical protein n=1 Tax=Streptomyces sp. NPDC029004 TaxID=3154490 RepID=UPI0033EE58F0
MQFRITGENGDESEETLALCAEAEGYYVDSPPPARHHYELRDCAPEGQLASAAAQAQNDGSAPLGLLTVHALDRSARPVEPIWDVWCLGDARVLNVRPSFGDPTLVDITVEGRQDSVAAGVNEQPEIPEVPPLFQGFHLSGRSEEPWGSCRQVALIDKQPEPDPIPLRLLRCEPSGRLLAANTRHLTHPALRERLPGRTGPARGAAWPRPCARSHTPPGRVRRRCQARLRQRGEQYLAEAGWSTPTVQPVPHSGQFAVPASWTASVLALVRRSLRQCRARQTDEQNTAVAFADGISGPPHPRHNRGSVSSSVTTTSSNRGAPSVPMRPPYAQLRLPP